MVVFAFKGDHCRVIGVRREQEPVPHGPPSLEEVEAFVREIADPDARLVRPKWLNRFRGQHRVISRYREGRVFFAGDTAHVHLPVGGQGMNTGMQDAFNLAWKLAAVVQGRAKPEPLLASYNAERHTVAEMVVKGTDEAFHTMIERGALGDFALRLLGPVVMRLEALQERMRSNLAEMNISYRGSALAEDRGGSNGPAAGDRAPDARIVRLPAMETVHLMDLFRGPQWTLLLLGGAQPAAEAVRELARLGTAVLNDLPASLSGYLVLTETVPGALIWERPILMDREHELHRKYGAHGACVYLVRPDGYVGFRGAAGDLGRLAEYLARVGIVR